MIDSRRNGEDEDVAPDRIAALMPMEKMELMNKCLKDFMSFWKDRPEGLKKGVNQWMDINTWLTAFCQWQYNMLKNQTNTDAKIRILQNISLQLGLIEKTFLEITEKEISEHGECESDLSEWERNSDGPSKN